MARRVYVIWANPLFRDTVCLLLEHPGIDIVGVNTVVGLEQALFDRLEPDTVIVEEASPEIPGGVAEALQILEKSAWCPRVILMNLKDNQLHIYHREQWTINTKDDLLEIISE